MRVPWRAALALAAHLALFAVPAALVLGLLGIAAYTVRYDLDNGLRAGLAALVVTTTFGIMSRGLLRDRNRSSGVRVIQGSQPQLWDTIRDVCETARAPVPDELRITCTPTVRWRERTRFLGLLGKDKQLEVGLPVLAGLTVAELSAALAMQVGKNGGARMAPLVMRTAIAVREASDNLAGGPTKWLFAGYARLHSALTAPVLRERTLHADKVAVRVAGRRTTVATLRKCVGVELGWHEFAREYLSMAVTVERTPELVLGFRAFLEHPERKKDLAERAKESAAQASTDRRAEPTATHRLEKLKRASGGPNEADDRPALALIRAPKQTIPALEDQLMVDGLGQRVPWSEVARLWGEHEVARKTGLLSAAVEQSALGFDRTPAGVLAAIHNGSATELINPALNPGLSPDHLDEAVVDTLTDLLGATVVDALIRAGHAGHELDWGGPPVVRLADGRALDPDRLVRPAVADPRLIPGLHRHLLHLGVPLDHAQPAADEPEAKFLGLVSPVHYAAGVHELIVTDRGLLLVPNRVPAARRLLAGALEQAKRSEQERLDELADAPVAELRERSDAQWVDTRDVATARLSSTRSGWTLTLELYLDDYAVSDVDPSAVQRADSEDEESEDRAAITIASTPDWAERGTPYSGLGELMGARLSADEQSH